MKQNVLWVQVAYSFIKLLHINEEWLNKRKLLLNRGPLYVGYANK